MVDTKANDRWALILGGSSGLGLATAKKLAAHDHNIIIIHRNPRHQMTEIEVDFDSIRAQGVKCLTFNIDATNAEKRQEAINQISQQIGSSDKIAILVHSLAKGNLKSMTQEEGEPVLENSDFNLTINAMAISLFDWTKDLYDLGLFAADSRIISFTSEGNSKAWKNYAAVSAAKVALEAITRNIALEFAPFGIRANCVQAGVTDTASLRMIPKSEELKELALKRNPFKRLTTPRDVADVVYLLSLPEAGWINGSIIPVDGGEHIS